ncbi:hypothetical protein GH733_000198 [Mirounga leonina]|nr:hypothetical protein GH733_000198 [Mirounga leonina]
MSCPLSLVPVGGFIAHVESTCLLDDDGTPKDFTYCVSFNKDLLTCWDPEEAKMAPCEFGALNVLANYLSEYLNQQESLLQRLSNGLQDCATHTQSFWGSLTHRTRPPTVQVAKTTPFNTKERVMLACYVWGFYPADVTISWRKNGQPIPSHSSAPKMAQPNGDWTYQTVSHLATTPSYGDTYTCVVEHIGAPEPVSEDWSKSVLVSFYFCSTWAVPDADSEGFCVCSDSGPGLHHFHSWFAQLAESWLVWLHFPPWGQLSRRSTRQLEAESYTFYPKCEDSNS